MAAIRLNVRVLCDVWWPVTLLNDSEEDEKLLTLWLNSTFGLILLWSNREDTEGAWVQFKKPVVGKMPILDVSSLTKPQRDSLLSAYDRLAEEKLLPFPSMAQDTVRAGIDRAFAETLDLPDTSILREGVGIATAGYPMGTNALTAPGYLHQIGPTLQKGILSAILPFPQPRPHAYSLNVMVQGGASGSPVFTPENGKIIGIIDSSLYDIDTNATEDNRSRKPTNISYAIPSYNILEFFEEIKASGELKFPTDAQTLEELFSSNEHEINFPGKIPGTVTRFDAIKTNEDEQKQ